jgi:hypothetical protein
MMVLPELDTALRYGLAIAAMLVAPLLVLTLPSLFELPCGNGMYGHE